MKHAYFIFILGDDDFIIQIPYAYMGIFWHIIVKICRYTIFQARFSTYQAYIKKAHPKDLIWNSPSVLHFAQVVIWTLPAHKDTICFKRSKKYNFFSVFAFISSLYFFMTCVGLCVCDSALGIWVWNDHKQSKFYC